MVFQLDQDFEYQKRDYLDRLGTTPDEAADTIGMRQYSHQNCNPNFRLETNKKSDALNQQYFFFFNHFLYI